MTCCKPNYFPPTQPHLVPRGQILARLTEKHRQGSKLTLLSAPAGLGKTTLAANWLHEAKIPVAWVSLNVEDDDPARFLAYPLAALRQHDVGTGETIQGMLAAQPPLELLLTAIFNDIVNQPALPNQLAVVLDDYHLIENQAIHQAMSFLIEHQPPQLHLVIITREDPPLLLARLRARQQMAEVRLADLRFTSDEVSVLLNDLMGLNLAPWHIEALADRSVPRSTFHPGYSPLELSWRQAHDQSNGHPNA